MKDLISIIIPVYNVESYLKKCLSSIINQTYTHLDIILIDDGSEDTSGKICDELANKDQRIQVIHQENHGVSYARNVGLDMARGTYIIFVDADDYVEKDFVEILYHEIKKSQVDLVACGYYLENNTDLQAKKLSQKEILYPQNLYKSVLDFDEGISQSPCNKIFKRKIIEENHIRFHTDISIGEDMIFCIEYISFCKAGITCEHILYHYIVNHESATHSNITNKQIEKALEGYEKVIQIYEKIGLQNYAKEKYIDTFKGYQSRAIESHLQDKNVLKKYSKICKVYFQDIKKDLTINKIIRNYVSLYMPKFYYILYKIKNR